MSEPDPRPTVIVIGAINVDLVVAGAPLPGPGETVVGGTFARHHGGKGGNQAVAAARALTGRGRVLMVGVTGEDDLGAEARLALSLEGVDVRHVVADPGEPTGAALIVVDEDGENQISVAPGANSLLTTEMVENAFGEIDAEAPCIVLASLEVPLRVVRTTAEACRLLNTPFVLNPAPAVPGVADLATLATVVTPNASELAALGELPPTVAVVETRGTEGAVIHAEGGTTRVPAPPAEIVDTTGAGDCFNGVLAAALLEEVPLAEATRRAVVAASLSVSTPGARDGMPTRDQIDAALARPG
ncbi:MAG: ribokinase [Actinomycetota bacterium]|nr:ribokinase [Actinomycetota bacterium]